MSMVSIIMPCHNGSKYIADAIQSVQNQTYDNWELIIINDGSSDDSEQIISRFAQKDSRIKLLVNQESTGLPATPRNIGIENANGRYIAFLDCDDEWIASKLERQIPLFEKENVAVVFGYYVKINEESEEISKIITSPETVTYKQLLNGDCIGNLTGVYDTYKVGKVLQKEIHAEDYLMWLEILKKGFIAMNTKTLEGRYRVSKTSLSGNKIKSAIWNWNIYKNELKMPLFSALFHFMFYLIKGINKFLR